jgi:DNA-binding ferritin-like protein
MKEIAVTLRGLQLFAHNAHNLAKGKTFLEDHEFFGELYAAYEGAYDDVVERMIGLGGDQDLNAITTEACDMATSANFSDNEQAFNVLLVTEKELCDSIKKERPKQSDGTQNLLQDIADKSEMRQYKLKRRLK